MAVASALDLVALVLDASHVAELVVVRATVAVRANPPSITGARPGCRAAVALPVAALLGALVKFAARAQVFEAVLAANAVVFVAVPSITLAQAACRDTAPVPAVLLIASVDHAFVGVLGALVADVAFTAVIAVIPIITAAQTI